MLVKKNPAVDINQYRSVFFFIGLIFSLLLMVFLFQLKMPNSSGIEGDFVGQPTDLIETQQVNTVQPPPPKPEKRVAPVKIVEVSDEEIIEIQEEFDLDIEIDEEYVIPDFVEAAVEIEDEEKEDDSQKIFFIVEKQAEYKGGLKAFYKYVSKAIDYPGQARRAGISGRVVVKFVVEKDGKITNTEVLKGIGFGCDEEAERVLKASPAWMPGKQRGNPVRVSMVLPIVFKLQE